MREKNKKLLRSKKARSSRQNGKQPVQGERATVGPLKLSNKRKLLFECIYRSDAGSDDNNEDLINMIKTASELNCSHIITVGDFNLTDINCKNGQLNLTTLKIKIFNL